MACSGSAEMKTMVSHSKELITVLSRGNPLALAEVVLDKQSSHEVLEKMLEDKTPEGRSVILIESVKNEISTAPEKLSDFIRILSDQSWTKDVADVLRSTYQSYQVSCSLPPYHTTLVCSQPHQHRLEQPLRVDGNIQVSSATTMAKEQVLTEKDVIHLLNFMHNFSDKWTVIGMGLGFTLPELTQIRCKPSLFMTAPTSCLAELLTQWVQWPTVNHPTKPTLELLCTSLRSSLVGLGSLAAQVETELKHASNGQENSIDETVDIATKIESLESQFDRLRIQIRGELASQHITVETLLDALTSLPLSLKKEYESSITESIPVMRNESRIEGLFIHLNPLLSFIDYGLIEFIIKKFGSDRLKRLMKSYNCAMESFMKQTTIQQLMHCLPGEPVIPPNFSFLRAKIGKSVKECTLERINNLRKRFCSQVHLSEVVFHLIAFEESNSFFVKWIFPSVLISKLVESERIIQSSFFENENVLSLLIDGKWLYNPKLFSFANELKERYQLSQISVSPLVMIPSPTRKIFRLAMIQKEGIQRGQVHDSFVRLTISGKIDDILFLKSPVELENIFKNSIHESDIILIEGAPGSGKSTLCLHVCQRWGKGELFEQFAVVILVQLRDPSVQRSQSIADLLPCGNTVTAKEIASEIESSNGCGVLWIVDGWDELPAHLKQKSIFQKLVVPPEPCDEDLKQIEQSLQMKEPHLDRGQWVRKLSLEKKFLNKSSVIVTSRPISSADLHQVVSSRIEVLGFTEDEQRQYFNECLKGDTNALETLLEKIKDNPIVQSICYIPLNAAFLVHFFKFTGQSLPDTEYEIYLTVILKCIRRHFEREGRGHDIPVAIKSLDDISRCAAVRDPFYRLCELAYHGVMENKVTFSSSNLSNTLSLLQGIESFLQMGKSVYYNFIHLTIQEILASYYMATCLSDSEQVAQFHQLYQQPRFIAVFQFYAAITKLKTPEIQEVIARLIETKSKVVLIRLLRCLYEAQNAPLCSYVAEKLQVSAKRISLIFNGISLSPLDCISISFFISMVTRSDSNEVFVDLDRCYIGDHGAKCLTKYLNEGIDHCGKITVHLNTNNVSEEGASSLARLMYTVEHLFMWYNHIGDMGASFISETIRVTNTLKTLSLYSCGITSSGAKDISQALAENTSLEKLDVGDNNLEDEGMSYLAAALQQNTTLKELWVGGCNISDEGAASLAKALSINQSLKMLHIGGRKPPKLTIAGISKIAQSLVCSSGFMILVIPQYKVFCSKTFHLKQEVNATRKKNQLSPIEIATNNTSTSTLSFAKMLAIEFPSFVQHTATA